MAANPCSQVSKMLWSVFLKIAASLIITCGRHVQCPHKKLVDFKRYWIHSVIVLPVKDFTVLTGEVNNHPLHCEAFLFPSREWSTLSLQSDRPTDTGCLTTVSLECVYTAVSLYTWAQWEVNCWAWNMFKYLEYRHIILETGGDDVTAPC